MGKAWTGLGLALALLGALATGSGATAPSAQGTAVVRIAPAVSTADEPLRIDFAGLPANAVALVELTSTDADGTRWRSAAEYRTSARGRLDLDRTAPLRGSYRGVWGMGLVTSMSPTTPSPLDAYAWDGGKPLTFTATVRVRDKVVAADMFSRALSPGPIRRVVGSLAKTGFVGEYFAPRGATDRPAVLAFGGAAGGLRTTLLASMLAARGYPTLAVAYFDAPGLPAGLKEIPLEYFQHALEWLHEQPEVDASHMLTLGISRGSEAALLLGVHFPDLVHGVIAAVPDNRAICLKATCTLGPWTLGGHGIPFTRQFDNPHPTDNPSAVIPVEDIHGPVFLACAEDDRTWPSCGFARAIMERLDAHGHAYRDVLYAAPGAGHRLGSLAPNEPVGIALLRNETDERARAAGWPKLIAFLDAVARSR